MPADHAAILITPAADQDDETLPLTPDMVRALLISVHDIAS